MDWKSWFWENWIQNLCFWKIFHLILMHFIHKIQCFEEFLHKIALFFKNLFFPEFQSIEYVFQSIEIAIKIFGQPLFVSIDARLILDQSKHFRLIEPNFRSIENRIESFLKTWFSHVQLTFQKVFKNSLSIQLVKAQIKFFLSFSANSFARFFSSKADKTLLPFLLHLFSSFMHFLGKFRTYKFLGVFWWFKIVFFRLINGFLF